MTDGLRCGRQRICKGREFIIALAVFDHNKDVYVFAFLSVSIVK